MSPPRTILWAPWRMDYILSPKGAEAQGSAPPVCIFCSLPASSPDEHRRNLVLAASEGYAVLLNRYPFAAGHLLVVPRRHVQHLTDLTAAEHDAFFAGVRDVSARLRQGAQPNGMNYGINEGAAAGAGIADHLHMHLVPRWSGDSNFMPVIADVRVMPEHLDATWQRLYPAFADLSGAAPLPVPSPRREA